MTPTTPNPAVPGDTILTPPEHLTREATVVLGWEGVVLPPMVILGRRVVVTAQLIDDVHERRVRSGWRPVTDRMSVATWEWPEMTGHVPAPAVRLTGVLAVVRHWRTGLRNLTPFQVVCPTAVLLPDRVPVFSECWRSAEYYGHGVLGAAGSGVDLVLPPRSRTERRWDGWVWPALLTHELVYQQLLGQSRQVAVES